MEYEVYVKHSIPNREPAIIMLCLHIDDLLVFGNCSKKKYARDILRRFNIVGYNPVVIPIAVNGKLEIDSDEELADSTIFKQIVDSLRYLCNTRLDICYSVGVVSRFMQRSKHSHWLAVKRIMRYVQGTIEHGILFTTDLKQENGDLVGYSYLDWCGDKNDRRSNSGYVFNFMKSLIAWSSKKQPLITLSSCETEHIAGSYSACQSLWLESLTVELKLDVCRPIPLMIDNISTINLAKNFVSH
ncbi:secreted RxLR effector protein 161-like [Cicer arietinum]|uniref:secreted RxLR effector protein 161-like n=1 Tax=Cicer arietinum TaxID=3827 RepID=UPI003CC6461A